MSKLNKESNSSTMDDKLLTNRNVITKRDNGRLRVQLDFVGDPGKTEQSHKDSTDITYMINQHVRMGGSFELPPAALQDYTGIPTYQEALNTVMEMDDLFNNLPLPIREAYGHDPAKLAQALEDPSQKLKVMETLGFTAKDGAPKQVSDTETKIFDSMNESDKKSTAE